MRFRISQFTRSLRRNTNSLMSNSKARKSCVVPKCVNTTTNAPEKLFIKVPPDAQMRERWIKAMKRLDPFGAKSCVYCCEDHFDIEKDMENYIRYKLVGGRIMLKKKVIPHKFECQQQKDDTNESSAKQKRNQKIFRKLLVEDAIPSTSNTREEVLAACPKAGYVIEDSLGSGNIEKFRHHKVQVVLKNKVIRKTTMTKQKYLKKRKDSTLNKTKSSPKNKIRVCSFADYSKMFTNDNYDPEKNSKGLESDDTECENVIFRNHLQKTTLLCTSRDPQLVLGLP